MDTRILEKVQAIIIVFQVNVNNNKIVGFGLIFMVGVGEITLYGLKKLKQRREIRPTVELSEEGR